MHKYLAELVTVGWIGTNWNVASWQRNKKLFAQLNINSQKSYKEARFQIEKEIKKLTSYLPEDFSMKYRIRCLRVPEINVKCPVCDGCRQLGLTGDGKDNFFYPTCGLKDSEHGKYLVKRGNEKRQETCQETLGSATATTAHLNQDNLKLLSKEYIEEKFIDENLHVKVEKFMDFLGCKSTAVFNFCKRFKVNYKPRRGSSQPEKNLSILIKKVLKDTIIVNNDLSIIKPNELDIYLPEYNLAIEYNGLLWHSHGIDKWGPINNPLSTPDRHLDKTKACQSKEIDLIHIFEDEYINNQDHVELLLKRKLGLEAWPVYTQDLIYWDLNHGNLPEQLQRDYEVIKTIPPRANYFKPGRGKEVSQWTPHKTEAEVYNAGYRKYYDCGELMLEKHAC